MKDFLIGAITYKTDHGYAQIQYFQKLSEVAFQQKVPFFVFSVDDMDYKNRRIHGLWFSPTEKAWQRRWTEYPTIVYDHVRYHPTAQFKRYVKLRKSGIIPFSYQGYSHKLGVTEYLSTFQDLSPYIPQTEKVVDVNQILTFLEQDEAILKPINGTGGRDIYLLKKEPNHVILYGIKEKDRKLNKIELERFLKQLVSKEPYMIQRRIPIVYDGRTCDTRVLLQKNQYGKWTLTGMGTRIGRASRIVSNLAKGASAIRTELFIEKYIGRSPEPIMEEIKEVGIKIAERLDQKYGNFVEFGLDIGITPTGSFQLIEANSKPDRKIFLKTNQPEQFKQAILKPFQYHLYLCKQLKSSE